MPCASKVHIHSVMREIMRGPFGPVFCSLFSPLLTFNSFLVHQGTDNLPSLFANVEQWNGPKKSIVVGRQILPSSITLIWQNRRACPAREFGPYTLQTCGGTANLL